jgi:hypothetical protein
MVKSAVCLVVALSLALVCLGLERPAGAEGAGEGAGSQPVDNVDFVAQIGGAVYGVAVRDGLAYLGRGPRLLVLDVTNPVHPVLLGQTEILPSVVLDVKLPAGEPTSPVHVYVTLGESGLGIIDVSNPRAPAMVSACPTSGSAMSLALGAGHLVGHTYAYVAQGMSGLSVVDVTDPLAPEQAGFYQPAEGFLRKLTIAAGAQAGDVYAYVADSWQGLRILDVSTTNNPLQVALFEISGGSGAEDVVVARNAAWHKTYGYVASPDHGLLIVDVTAAGAPVEVGRFGSVEVSGVLVAPGESPGDMVAYVAGYDFEVGDSHIGGLGILDVSDPSDPTLESVCKLEASPRNMTADGGLVYIANGHLDIVDVADAAAATWIGAYGASANSYSGDLTLRGDLACLASYSGLWIVDVANPLRPVDRGSWTGSLWTNDVALNGDYAYLSAEYAGLHVIDISNPALPDRVTTVGPGDARAVEVPASEGGASPYAYVANSSRGLIVLGVSNAANPVELGASDPLNLAWSVAVTDREAPGPTYAYVGALWNRVWALDISDPTRPDVVGDWTQPTLAYDLAVADGYLYAAAGDGLYVADISSPTLPIQVSEYPLATQSVAVAGEYAYLGADGLRVLDVTDPAAPTEAGFYETPGGARDVAVAGPLVYVAAGEGGLVILWFAPPTVASIPAAGGSLAGPFDATTYTFAPGTFTDTVTVTHAPRFFGTMTSTGELVGIRHFFETTAVYRDSGQPAAPLLPFTLMVEYSDSELALAVEETLGLWAWDGEEWGQAGIDSVVQVSENRVSAQVDRFSLFGVLGEVRRVFLPLVLKGE